MKWLDRRIARPGPYLCLCLSEKEYKTAMKHCGLEVDHVWLNDNANATTHLLRNQKRELCCIVCLGDVEGRLPIEVAGILIHEAVHVWQEYCADIGETHPASEQEAYAIQSVSQELLAEFARRLDNARS
jgi:hypothetical protein